MLSSDAFYFIILYKKILLKGLITSSTHQSGRFRCGSPGRPPQTPDLFRIRGGTTDDPVWVLFLILMVKGTVPGNKDRFQPFGGYFLFCGGRELEAQPNRTESFCELKEPHKR